MAPKNERCQHSWKHQIDSSWFSNKFCANFIHNKKVAWKSSSNNNPIFNPTMICKKSDKFQFSPVTVKSVDFVNSFAPVWWTSITSSSSWMLQPLRYINTWYFQSILVFPASYFFLPGSCKRCWAGCGALADEVSQGDEGSVAGFHPLMLKKKPNEMKSCILPL